MARMSFLGLCLLVSVAGGQPAGATSLTYDYTAVLSSLSTGYPAGATISGSFTFTTGDCGSGTCTSSAHLLSLGAVWGGAVDAFQGDVSAPAITDVTNGGQIVTQDMASGVGADYQMSASGALPTAGGTTISADITFNLYSSDTSLFYNDNANGLLSALPDFSRFDLGGTVTFDLYSTDVATGIQTRTSQADGTITSVSLVPVPEPMSAGVLGVALLGVATVGRRRG